LNENIAALVFG